PRFPKTGSTSPSNIGRRWDPRPAPPRSPATARPQARSRGSRRCGDSYARLVRDEVSTILMNSPRRPDGPPIYDGKSYSAAAHLAEDVKPFVAIANGLRARGFSAPAVRYADLEAGLLITEDFGTGTVIEGNPPSPIADRYQ